MPDLAAEANAALEAELPALAAALSPLGRAVAFPPDIPLQAAQARDAERNATIGQITDGAGSALGLPSMHRALAALEGRDRDRAFLYSPIAGFGDLRAVWRRRQRRGQPPSRPSSLPLVTDGLTHGLSLLADLFAGPGRPVAAPAPLWGNYLQTFARRTGARLVTAPAYRDGRYNTAAIAEALADQAEGAPALGILNLPSNPGGYAATVAERAELIRSLTAVAARRPLLVLCDDAYAGLVYEPEVPRGSMFWELAGVHPNLVPVKIDGATKELGFFGGRVGFLTFPVEPGSPAAAALESKVTCLVRATVGSPVAASQVIVRQALAESRIDEEIEAVRRLLEGRYRCLRGALDRLDPALLRPLPSNAGCFALLELGPALRVRAEEIRRHLLATESAGLVAIGDRYLRIAFCSVAEEALPDLVIRIERGVRALAAAS